jgi:hypothetical protein
MMRRAGFSRQMRAAQLEYSRAESDILTEKALFGPDDLLRSRVTDLHGSRLIRVFIIGGKEAELRARVGDAAVDRWLTARDAHDRLHGDPRHNPKARP